MFKNYIVLDAESFYSSKEKYSLRNMTPVEYLLDPRFELIGMAVIEVKGGIRRDPFWIDGPDFGAYARSLRQRQRAGEKLVVLSHNSLFDCCLIAWRYGLVPDLMVDTMGMSQALLHPKVGFVSLSKISDYLGIGTKGDTVMRVDGMRRADIIAAGLYQRYSDYSLNDAVLCEQIAFKLFDKFPRQEFIVMDTVIRCAVLPKFRYDTDVLYEHLANVQAAKAALLAQAGVEVDEWGKAPMLMSNPKFAEMLEGLGVEPPMKISPTTGKLTHAFSKADQGMADLQEHDDPMVQALVAARLGVKSTLEETRTQRFIAVAAQQWPGQPEGQCWAPMPLKYSGAHTHRLCLVGSTAIVVLRDGVVADIRLDQLLLSDLVWDGIEFVSHGGLSYAGVKPVIEYDTIIGTPDHRVRTLEQGYCGLAEAKARKYNIARGAIPSTARINSYVQRFNRIQNNDPIHLQQVPSLVQEHVEGFAVPGSSPVPIVREQGANAQPLIMPTWDIIGCGPRNCFTANGRIVHNSGDWKLNKQNMPRGGRLRDALVAPPGHVVVTCDASQIEARLAAWVAAIIRGEQSELVDGFARGEDVYSLFASKHLYMRTITKTDKKERFVGKQAILGCFAANTKVLTHNGWKPIVSVLVSDKVWDGVEWVAHSGLMYQGVQETETFQGVSATPSHEILTGHGWRTWNAVHTNHSLFQSALSLSGSYSGMGLEMPGSLTNKKTRQKLPVYDLSLAGPRNRFTIMSDAGPLIVHNCGFGMGHIKFRLNAIKDSRLQLKMDLDMSLEEAKRIVNGYRFGMAPAVPKAWKTLEMLMPDLATRDSGQMFGPMTFGHKEIIGPTGLPLFYPELRQERTDRGLEWRFKSGRMDKGLFGGKLYENIIQHLARCCNMECALKVRKHFGIDLALQAHDELIYVVPGGIDEAGNATGFAKEFMDGLLSFMRERPAWGMSLPLDAEAGVGHTYGQCK